MTLKLKHVEWISPEPLNSAQAAAMTEVFAQSLHEAWRAEARRPLTIDRLAVEVEQGASTRRGLLKQAAQRTAAQILSMQGETKR